MTARNCIVLLFSVLLACAFPVSAAQNNYWQQQQWQQQQQMQQRQMQQQQEMMRRQQEQMRQQQQMQQQQRILQQQRARQASEQARAAQQRAIRDQDKRRQFSQRQNMAQKLQQQKAMEQNNRLKTQRRLTQQRLVQQKILQKNRQAQEQKNRDIGVLALIGSTPRTSMSPQLSERIRNVTQKSANDNNPTKVSAGNTGNINRSSGKKTGNGNSGRPSFKLTKVFNQNAKLLSKDVALRLDSVTKGAGKEISILRDAAKGKGNFGLGSGTRIEADKLGRTWVGDGYKVASDGKTLISKDGMRQYRPPSYKPKLGKIQANFERRLPSLQTKEWHSNGHLDITD